LPASAVEQTRKNQWRIEFKNLTMNKLRWIQPLLIVLLTMSGSTIFAQGAPETLGVLIYTELGTFEIEVYAAKAPITAANFLRYIDSGLYNGGVVHRTVKPDNQPNNLVKIEVIQAGIRAEMKNFAPIKLERTNLTGVKHVAGAISMARSGPDSATSDFFICIGAQPELDFCGKRNPDGQGFAAFGKVVKGLEVVKKIQQAPAEGQRLKPPIKILRIKRKQ
jgi:peptidyl-prolyl cis-trans isomerase A (cyclophilin A)